MSRCISVSPAQAHWYIGITFPLSAGPSFSQSITLLLASSNRQNNNMFFVTHLYFLNMNYPLFYVIIYCLSAYQFYFLSVLDIVNFFAPSLFILAWLHVIKGGYKWLTVHIHTSSFLSYHIIFHMTLSFLPLTCTFQCVIGAVWPVSCFGQTNHLA